jgi:hypothetical protein
MKTIFRSAMVVFLLAVVLGPLPAYAQALLGVEGPIQRVLPLTNEMIVMGIRVRVPPGTPITTPTTTLTGIRDLLGAPLPGRTQAGFLGGTAIINGTIVAGVPTAGDVFVEPSENVLIGTISANTCTNARCFGPGNFLDVNGARLVPIRDPRMAAGPVTNEFGFAANLTGVNLVGRAAESEGYFARRRFHYFLLSVTGAPLANPGVAEVSILRAQCRDDAGGIQLDVLGNTHPRGVVTITDGAGTTFGTQATIAAGVGFGAYTFRLRGNPAFATCPTSVTVEFGVASATADVDIIP